MTETTTIVRGVVRLYEDDGCYSQPFEAELGEERELKFENFDESIGRLIKNDHRNAVFIHKIEQSITQ